MQDSEVPSQGEPAASSVVPPPGGRPRRRLGWLAIGIAAIAVVVALRVLHRKAPQHEEPAQVVGVATAALGSMPVTVHELGTVTPITTVTVLPMLSGYITEVAYHEGQDVRKGQFLVQIDPRQYEIDKEQAEGQLVKDLAALGQARADLARYTRLHATHSIAEQIYVDQKYLVQQYEGAVKTDRANIAQYNLDLIYCHVTAPVAGRVGLRLVDVGNFVTASSQPALVVVTTMKPTTVEFSIPQNALGDVVQRFNTGAKLPVAIYDSEDQEQIATGTLYAISNQMATATGTFTLRAMTPNRDEALFPNEFVNVTLTVDTLHGVVLVPTPAIQTGAPGTYVFVVNRDDTVSVRKITVGPGNGRYTVVRSGLAAGARVVTDGLDRLHDGAKIRPAPATAPATQPAPTRGTGSAAGAPHPPARAS